MLAVWSKWSAQCANLDAFMFFSFGLIDRNYLVLANIEDCTPIINWCNAKKVSFLSVSAKPSWRLVWNSCEPPSNLERIFFRVNFHLCSIAHFNFSLVSFYVHSIFTMVTMKTNFVHFQMEYGFVSIGKQCRVKKVSMDETRMKRWEINGRLLGTFGENVSFDMKERLKRKHLNDSNKSSSRSWRIWFNDNDDDCVGTILIWWTLHLFESIFESIHLWFTHIDHH